MEIGSESTMPPQQTEAPAPAVGIPVTETPAETQKGIKAWFKRRFGGSKNEPMVVGSGMAEQLPDAGQQLDSGTTDRTDFATASTATGGTVDAASVLSDMNKQIDTTAQMGAQINNPIGGLPPVSMETPSTAPVPDNPTATTEPAPLVPPTEKAAA